MKQYVVTAEQMKRYDANTTGRYHMPSLLLMERAALATVDELLRERGQKPCRVLVAAGCGNNGGDGLAIGRLLKLRGFRVDFALLGDEEKRTAETTAQIDILRAYGAQIDSTIKESEYDIVIDAIFGVGLSRDAAGIHREAIERINRMEAYVCSVDIPSGIDADTGAVMGCAVRADLTVTYGFRKVGHLLYPGARYTGRLVCRDIGIDERSFFGETPRWYTYIGGGERLLPPRRPDGNKGTFGKALVIAGSREVAGAAMMAVKSVFRVGAGMVKAVTAVQNKEALQQFVPEAMLVIYAEEGLSENIVRADAWEMFLEELRAAEAWADCVLIGPGIGLGEPAHELLRFCVKESGLPLVIDADGLNLLAQNAALQKALADCGRRGRDVILTPHLGEFARLYGCTTEQAKAHLTEYPRQLSDRLHCTVVCKDARTVVVRPDDGESYLNTTGNSGMATAGSGDVLAGMITGLLAQGMPGADAAVAGVYLHGRAGDLAAADRTEPAMMATDMIDRIGEAALSQPADSQQDEMRKTR